MANEFKIKNALQILQSQPVAGITNSSNFTNDTSTLATVNAIKGYIDASLLLYLELGGGEMSGLLTIGNGFTLDGQTTITVIDASNPGLELKDSALVTGAAIGSYIDNVKLGGLFDVSLNGVTDGSSLVYRSAGQYWTYGVGGGGGAVALEDLTDVSVSGRANFDFLQWDNDTSTWINVSPLDASTIFAIQTNVDASFLLYETKVNIDASFAAISGVSLGTENQVPFMNAGGTDFEYGGIYWTGYNIAIADGSFNTFVSSSWSSNNGGFLNTGFGYLAGEQLDSGSSNSFFGALAGGTFDVGSANTFIGAATAAALNSGNYNVIIGGGAGAQLIDASMNVMIGANAGYNETGNYKLYIDSYSGGSGNDSSSALIFGEFNGSRKLRINAAIVEFNGITEASKSKTLYYDTTTKRISYGDPSTGVAVAWGNITGNVTGQTDLWTILTDLSTNVFYLESSVGALDTLTQNLDASLDLYLPLAGGQISGNLGITGNLTVDGSMYIVGQETIDVSSAYIYMNTGLTGAPPTSLQSGIIVARGTADPYAILYDETLEQFRIGIAPFSGSQYNDVSTQAVATREDSPIPYGVSWWDGSSNRFDTSINLTYNPGTSRLSIWNFDLEGVSALSSLKHSSTTFLSASSTSTTLQDGASSGAVVISGTGLFLYHDTTIKMGYSTAAENIYFQIDPDGQVYCPSINSGYQSKALYYNTTSGEITYQDPSGGGTGGGYWTLDGSLLYPTDPTVDVKLSEIQVGTDAGAVTVINMDVSSAVVDTEESYSFNMDGSTVMKIYGKSTGSSAVSETAVVIEATYQYFGDPITNGSWRMYVNGTGDFVIEKRVSGSWVEKGKYV